MTGGEDLIGVAIACGLFGVSAAKLSQAKAGRRLKAGQRVYHGKHGYGVVDAVRRTPGSTLGGYYTHATVKFDDGPRMDIPADKLKLR